MKLKKCIERRVKGSVVIEAAIVSPLVIFIVLMCLGIVTMEFLDSVRTIDFAIEESKYNGVGVDNRQMADVMIGVSQDKTEAVLFAKADFDQDKLSGAFSASDNGQNIKNLLFNDDLEIDIGSFKVVNWLIARERLRNMYK